MSKNPFSQRSPVMGDNFFNREADFDAVVELFSHDKPVSVSLVAPPRMGASSFLLQLHTIVGPQRLPDLSFHYLDLDGIHTRQEYFTRMAEILETEDATAAGINQAIALTKKKCVVALDGLEHLVARPEQFTTDFYQHLRSIGNHRQLTLIISSMRPIKQLDIPWHSSAGSPFHVVFKTVALAPWTRETCERFLIQRFAQAEITLPVMDLEFLLITVAGKSPHHLQVLADHYFQAYRKGRVNHESVLNGYKNEIDHGQAKRAVAWKPWHWRVGAYGAVIVGSLAIGSLLISFGLPRYTSRLECGDVLRPDKYRVAVEHPAFLARGDTGMVQLTLQNAMTETQTLAMLLNFSEPVQLDGSATNRVAFQDMTPNEQRSGVLAFHRQTGEPIQLIVQIQTAAAQVDCSPAANATQPTVQVGRVPYLMTLWRWLAAVGAPASLLGLVVDAIKRGVAK